MGRRREELKVTGRGREVVRGVEVSGLGRRRWWRRRWELGLVVLGRLEPLERQRKVCQVQLPRLRKRSRK